MRCDLIYFFFFFFQAEDGIRDKLVTRVQTCALPISLSADEGRRDPRQLRPLQRRDRVGSPRTARHGPSRRAPVRQRSEEHTSELQSLAYLVCRLLLEKKKLLVNTGITGNKPIPFIIPERESATQR